MGQYKQKQVVLVARSLSELKILYKSFLQYFTITLGSGIAKNKYGLKRTEYPVNYNSGLQYVCWMIPQEK